jgi:hypothetical protein
VGEAVHWCWCRLLLQQMLRNCNRVVVAVLASYIDIGTFPTTC